MPWRGVMPVRAQIFCPLDVDHLEPCYQNCMVCFDCQPAVYLIFIN